MYIYNIYVYIHVYIYKCIYNCVCVYLQVWYGQSRLHTYVAACCCLCGVLRALQRVAVCCSVLCVVGGVLLESSAYICYSVLQCVQCVAAYCIVLQCLADEIIR